MKKVITLILLATIVGLFASTSIKDISPKCALGMILCRPELVVIDVSSQFEKGHIPAAKNYSVGDGTLYENIQNFDKSKKYLIYADNDVDSQRGAQLLNEHGFENVYRLKGNFKAWTDSGYRVAMN